MSLSTAEKAAGRAFRDWCAARLGKLEAQATCPPYIVWYRHECKPGDRAVQSGTWAMSLRQHYWTSPGYVLSRGEARAFASEAAYTGAAELRGDLEEAGMERLSVAEALVPPGLFAFTFRVGQCPRCGLTVRSGTGRFVLAAANPPEKGAVVAAQQPDRVVPEDQEPAAHAPGHH